MNLPDLEAEALKLPVGERARLAETLLESLEALSEDEHRRLWTEEATRRDAELDADPVPGATGRGGLSGRTSAAPLTLPVIFHELAEEELNEAAAFYARARPGLGDRPA